MNGRGVSLNDTKSIASDKSTIPYYFDTKPNNFAYPKPPSFHRGTANADECSGGQVEDNDDENCEDDTRSEISIETSASSAYRKRKLCAAFDNNDNGGGGGDDDTSFSHQQQLLPEVLTATQRPDNNNNREDWKIAFREWQKVNNPDPKAHVEHAPKLVVPKNPAVKLVKRQFDAVAPRTMWCVIGKKGSGKTKTNGFYLEHLNQNWGLRRVVVFSSTEPTNHFYENIGVSKDHIYTTYSDDIAAQYVWLQEIVCARLITKHGVRDINELDDRIAMKYTCVIILDDFAHACKQLNASHVLKQLILAGRHKLIQIGFLAQRPIMIPCDWRSQFDTCFLRTCMGSDKQQLFKDHFGEFDNVTEFTATAAEYTKPGRVLVANLATGESSKESVYYYIEYDYKRPIKLELNYDTWDKLKLEYAQKYMHSSANPHILSNNNDTAMATLDDATQQYPEMPVNPQHALSLHDNKSYSNANFSSPSPTKKQRNKKKRIIIVFKHCYIIAFYTHKFKIFQKDCTGRSKSVFNHAQINAQIKITQVLLLFWVKKKHKQINIFFNALISLDTDSFMYAIFVVRTPIIFSIVNIQFLSVIYVTRGNQCYRLCLPIY